MTRLLEPASSFMGRHAQRRSPQGESLSRRQLIKPLVLTAHSDFALETLLILLSGRMPDLPPVLGPGIPISVADGSAQTVLKIFARTSH